MPTIAQIEAWLDQILEVEFSFRNTAEAVRQISRLAEQDQHYVISWVRRVASTNVELGYQYALHVHHALVLMERESVEAWALHAMDTYDRSGLRPALQVIWEVDDFIRINRERAIGCVLQEHERVLTGFLRGLSGRKLKIQSAEQIYTDTETLFLPPLLAILPSPEQNFLLYKVMITALWAQTRFGTFRTNLGETLATHPNPQRILALFQCMENLRLEAIIARELPGLYRQLDELRSALGEPPLPEIWEPFRQRVSQRDCSARDVLMQVCVMPESVQPYNAFAYQGVLLLDQVDARITARLEREKALFRIKLKMLEEELREQSGNQSEKRTDGSRFGKREIRPEERPEELQVEILLHDKPLPLPDDIKELITSITLDLGEIPDDYLQPAGPGEYDPALLQQDNALDQDVWQGSYHEEGAFLYQEWDFRRQHYRKDWCAAREKSVEPVYDGFAEQTLEKYSGLVKQLRRTFEAMRDENRLLKRQTQGDSVDLDALVEALADARDGREMTDQLFARQHRSERNIAVLFMVDMSGSTKGWINTAEKESLVLLCEALETLGDRYAIYGFSSISRKRCELYHVKHFCEHYDNEVRARISGIRPHDYTRMGFAIRHLSGVLTEVDARTRVLITLSDGKPDDYDGYRGEYGIEDTRRALIEARRRGIHPYCITIDEQARDYLPQLYGPAAYTLVDEVAALPLKVSDIYRRLTT
ncbi:MAG: nitric oxide reductase activation protein [Chromatiaceae bacterium]|nr:nitric oxide reductase activation protein [Chromatiaceae bacterium]